MTECQCVNVVITNPPLVVCACHECLCSIVLIVNVCWYVWMYRRLQHHSYSLLPIHVCIVRCSSHSSITVNHHVTKNTLCSIVNHIFLIDHTVHLGSKSYELHDSITIMFILENGSRYLLIEVDKVIHWMK